MNYSEKIAEYVYCPYAYKKKSTVEQYEKGREYWVDAFDIGVSRHLAFDHKFIVWDWFTGATKFLGSVLYTEFMCELNGWNNKGLLTPRKGVTSQHQSQLEFQMSQEGHSKITKGWETFNLNQTYSDVTRFIGEFESDFDNITDDELADRIRSLSQIDVLVIDEASMAFKGNTVKMFPTILDFLFDNNLKYITITDATANNMAGLWTYFGISPDDYNLYTHYYREGQALKEGVKIADITMEQWSIGTKSKLVSELNEYDLDKDCLEDWVDHYNNIDELSNANSKGLTKKDRNNIVTAKYQSVAKTYILKQMYNEGYLTVIYVNRQDNAEYTKEQLLNIKPDLKVVTWHGGSELFEKFKGNTELFKQYLLDNKIDVCVFVEMGKRGEEFDNIQHVIDANYRLTGPGLDDFNHKKGRLNRGHGISNKTMTIVVDPYLIAKTEKQRKSEKLDKFLKDFYGSEYDKMSEREKSDRLLAIKNMLDLKASDSRSLDPEGETYAINGDMSFETNEDLLERLLKNVKSNDDMFNDIFNEYADVGCDVISVKYYVEHIDTDKVVIDTLSPRDFVIPEYETLTSSEALRRVLASVS